MAHISSSSVQTYRILDHRFINTSPQCCSKVGDTRIILFRLLFRVLEDIFALEGISTVAKHRNPGVHVKRHDFWKEISWPEAHITPALVLPRIGAPIDTVHEYDTENVNLGNWD